MDLSVVTGRRLNREITGPTPHSVAIRGKPPPRKPPEYLILELRKQEKLREEAEAIVNYTKQFDLKTTWERETDKKIKKNSIKRKMDSLLQQQKYSLEERRDKLRKLLHEEEEKYMSEVAIKQETVLERQAKMRERAKQLRDKREAERLLVVEEKLDQRWRDQCEEMRGLMSRRHQDEVFVERKEQLRLKAERKEREKQEEKIYTKMWQEDFDAKSKREEMETALKIERNREMLKLLTLQSASMENHKDKLKKLKEQEAEHLREEAALRALEEQRAREEKRRSQEQTRAELNLSLRLKMKRKTREMQEELAMDMKILEQILQESSDESNEQLQRKLELRNEMRQYREYLAEQKKEEEIKEKDLDQLVTEEVEKQWAKRIAHWKKEKEARRRLMEDVLQTRHQQIKEKLEGIAMKKKELEEESKALETNYIEHCKLEEERQQRIRQKNIEYQQDLLSQIKFQEVLKEKEKEEERKELVMAKEAEDDYQRRVQRVLLNPDLKKTHPRKLMAMQHK